MNEIKLWGGALVVLLVGAYLSWTADRTPGASKSKVVLLDTKPESVESIVLVSKTSTVTITFKKDQNGERYPWFEVKSADRTRPFAGSDRFDARLKSFAPFEALRSLGVLEGAELKETGLQRPERRLTLTVEGRTKVFDVGSRTSGARDHYVRGRGSEEVHLVDSRVLGDLEFPEGQYMQRQLFAKDMKEVDRLILADSAGRTKTLLHRNRQSPEDAFWATEDAPDTLNETYGNYLDKLSKLTVSEYLEDTTAFDRAVPVLEAKWLGEDGKVLGTVTLTREGGDKKDPSYFALSAATRAPVKVARFTAEQLEHDLDTVFSGRPAEGRATSPNPNPNPSARSTPKPTSAPSESRESPRSPQSPLSPTGR